MEDGFNTPKWIYNVSVSKKNLVKNIDATLAYRWQSKYLSQTFLVSGQVPSYSSLDAQVSYHIPVIKSLIKLGATNLLNRYYNSFLGGPAIGGMYYVSVGYGIN